MILAVVLASRQSSTLRKGILKARFALSRSFRMMSYGSACLQLVSRYCFHLGLRSRTSRNYGSIFCLASCPHSTSTFPLLSRISKSQSLEFCPALQAVISASSSLSSRLSSRSGVVLATVSTSFAQICRERKAGRFSTASLSFATLFFAISIFASSCFGKMFRVSLFRIDRQYASPFTSSRQMNSFSSESYIFLHAIYYTIRCHSTGKLTISCGTAGLVKSCISSKKEVILVCEYLNEQNTIIFFSDARRGEFAAGGEVQLPYLPRIILPAPQGVPLPGDPLLCARGVHQEVDLLSVY